jgi:hypothetical protein
VTARALLRAASVIALVQGAAHLLAMLRYAPHRGPAETMVVNAMRDNFFHFGGPFAHSFWEMYFGYALMVAANCFVEAALLWIVSGWDALQEMQRPLLWLVLVANLIHGALVLRYFFLTPLFMDSLIVLCMIAILVMGRRSVSRAIY